MSDPLPDHTILLLGAGGRLGRLLRAAGAQAPSADARLFFQSSRPLPGPDTLIWSPDLPASALPSCDTVVALWGQTSGDAEALAANSALADHSRRVTLVCGARRCLHLSSAAIYGPARAAREDRTAPRPANTYGEAKHAMEQRVATFDDAPLHHCCLRLANVVGADSLAGPLRAAAPVTLDRFADGNGPLRSYIGAGDLLSVLTALSALAPERLPTYLNVAAPAPVAMQDLATAAGKDIDWRDAPAEAVQEVTLDATRLTGLLPDLAIPADARTLIEDWHMLERLADR